MLKVEIEKHSGFCGGVIRAIGKAESFLEENPGKRLYSLGAIVHNEGELKRLEAKGLETVALSSLDELSSPEVQTVLIRAHGEPPSTYSVLRGIGVNVIDCTCPVVLRLQAMIKETYSRLRPAGGQVIIFGKIGHPEVLGLLGQVDGDAIVIEDMAMLEEAVRKDMIDLRKPLAIFSQTTKSPVEYGEIIESLKSKANAGLETHDTICSQVSSRHKELSDFAASHDVIVFVSGKHSSNGKVLRDLCASVNPRTFNVPGPEEINPGWFSDGDSVGVCGATSTPRWLLESVSKAISDL